MNDDLSQLSLLELFRVETETQAGILTRGLLELERGEGTEEGLEAMMRAAHSLKGAARIVKLGVAVEIAHALEDSFVAAQKDPALTLAPGNATEAGGARTRLPIDELLRGVDLLVGVSQSPDPAAWEKENEGAVARYLRVLRGGLENQRPVPALPGTVGQFGTAAEGCSDDGKAPVLRIAATDGGEKRESEKVQPAHFPTTAPAQTWAVRLGAENLNRLLGLAGETLVESRWPGTFLKKCAALKRLQSEIDGTLEKLRPALASGSTVAPVMLEQGLRELLRQSTEVGQNLAERLEELDLYDRRTAHLSNRLYLEVLRARMRPFGDSEGVRSFPRMVRDLARTLGKQVKLEIHGENTQVDRDILERLEAPLNHLLRNAVDHGCETPEERERAGKSREATIRLEARHSAGMLMIVVTDDGAGVDARRVRRLIADKKLTTAALAERMNESELLEFLFLPGFTLRERVTEISGRGIGLDIVQNLVRSVRGKLRVNSEAGRGMRIQMQLPLTTSVVRTLLVEVGGEPYAIPLAQIVSTLKLSRESSAPLSPSTPSPEGTSEGEVWRGRGGEKLEPLEGRHHVNLGEEHIGLLAAHQVLDCPDVRPPATDLPVVVLGDRNARYGVVVDRFLGERELVVQPLDPRLGKIKDISAAALMEDGAPVLILDVDDMLRSIEKLIAAGTLADIGLSASKHTTPKRKRILAVDDSLTVRELERKLLHSHGYEADVAVDGMDGWNAVRTGVYDLVITDVDMPRMDGIELATLIKRDPQLKSLPVMIVSYKDREEDRLRGLNAGADYYLTKGSFHDETLLQAVQDLIGEPGE